MTLLQIILSFIYQDISISHILISKKKKSELSHYYQFYCLLSVILGNMYVHLTFYGCSCFVFFSSHWWTCLSLLYNLRSLYIGRCMHLHFCIITCNSLYTGRVVHIHLCIHMYAFYVFRVRPFELYYKLLIWSVVIMMFFVHLHIKLVINSKCLRLSSGEDGPLSYCLS